MVFRGAGLEARLEQRAHVLARHEHRVAAAAGLEMDDADIRAAISVEAQVTLALSKRAGTRAATPGREQTHGE